MHSIRLYYNKQRVKKDGSASLYFRVIISREKKDFPLQLTWPIEKINLDKQELLPRRKNDPDVSDYNLLIDCEKARHTEIQRTYRLRNEELTLAKLAKEIKIFSTNACFTSYIEIERSRRFKLKEIEKNTYQNAHSTKISLLRYDPLCLFKDINLKWMNGYKSFLRAEGYMPGSIWAKISCTKGYLNRASKEPMIYVDPAAVNFPNPKVEERTTYLDIDELRRMIILLEADLHDVQFRVLQAFLFTCFTGLRISDLYLSNSKWELQTGFLDFCPYKGRKKGKWIRIPLIPIARNFIPGKETYFKLPNKVEYNETLKELAEKAEINKNLTSHVGRHTFGFLFMKNEKNIFGLKELLGHSKIETTMRYAHLNDEGKMESARKIEGDFSDLVNRIHSPY